MNDKPKLIMIAAAIIVIIAAFGIWYWQSQKPASEPEPIKTTEDVVSAVTVQEIDVRSNPVGGKVPEVNPVDRANPFKDAYNNPFE